jgi:hypothetical protein
MTAGPSNLFKDLPHGVAKNFTDQVEAAMPADVAVALAAEPRLLRQWADAAMEILVADWTGHPKLYPALVAVVPPGVRLTEITGRAAYAQFVWSIASGRVELKISIGKGHLFIRVAPFVGDASLYQQAHGPVSRQLEFETDRACWETDLAAILEAAFIDLLAAL